MIILGSVLLGVVTAAPTASLSISPPIIMAEIRWRVDGNRRYTRQSLVARREQLAASLTKSQVFELPLLICLLVGLVIGLLLWLSQVESSAMMGFGVTFAVICLGIQLLAANEYASEVMQKRYLCEVIFRYTPLAEPVDQLLVHHSTGNTEGRLEVLKAIRPLVRADIFERITHRQDQPYAVCQLLARALPAILESLRTEGPPLSVEPIRLLETLPRRTKRNLIEELNARVVSAGPKTAVKILQSQYFHLESFPHVYCLRCLSRPHKIDFKDISWLQCKICKDATNLMHPVREVIGQIGGVAGSELQDGVLRINLWDAARSTALPAEVDALEVIAGQDFDYNWAITAVLERLRNPINQGTRLQLIGELELDEHTRRHLAGRWA